MTANHEHTPTTWQVEAGFALYLHDYENIVISFGRDRFKAWLAERDARITAAAEQRGAIKALREARQAWYDHADQMTDMPSKYYPAVWLRNRADRLEDDDA